jgi:hypothetical protein
MTRTQTIFEGDDQTNADFIRACVKSLGQEIPSNWTDEQVVQFFNTVSKDSPRLYTDMEKADMKYEAQAAE